MTQIGNRNSPVPITAAQLQDGLITASKIANGQITEEKVANSAITSSKIADGEVTESKLANNAITSSKIADGEVTESKLANNAITSSKIADGEVTESKLANNVVDKLIPDVSGQDGKYLSTNGTSISWEVLEVVPEILTTAERLALSNTSFGKLVFDTNINKLFIYNGTVWEKTLSTDIGADTIVATPTITVEGSPSSVLEDPTITTSAFTLTQGSDTHLSTDWEILRTSNNEVVYSSFNDTSNLTSIVVPAGNLEVSNEYEFCARHRTATFSVSGFGSATANTRASFLILDTLGETACGGFYIGTICAASTCYYLIVAPNATGCASCAWKTTNSATSGTTSCVDGRSNTYGPLNNATHPAGNWTATRTINGFSDWYLPSRDELNQLYVNDGGATNTNLPAGEGFAAVGYWSSTQISANYACVQNFFNGVQYTYRLKASIYPVRAIRREPI
jgi:hypothetical protein